MNSFKLLLIFLLLSVPELGKAQINVDWLKQHYNTNFAKPKSLTTDPDGNIIMYGIFRGEIDMEIFDETVEANQPWIGFYMAKFSVTGQLLWWRPAPLNISATGLDISNVFIRTDSQGNIYAVSTETNTAILIRKYDSSGQVLWEKTSNECWTSISGIEFDSKDNIYISGHFFNCGRLEYDDVVISRTPERTYFLLKLDADGNALWGDRGYCLEGNQGLSISINSNDEIFVAGEFSGPRFFLGSFEIPDASTVINSDSGFLAKYDSDGNVVWLNSFPNVYGSLEIAADNFGNTYVSVHNWIHLFDNGGEIVWSKEFNTIGPTYDHHVDTDALGNCYGCYSWGTDGINQNSIEIFCYKSTSYGDVVWSERIGSERQDAIEDMLVSESGDQISICGYFNGDYFEIGDTTIIDTISGQTTFYGGLFQNCPTYTLKIDSTILLDKTVELTAEVEGHDIDQFEIQWYSVENQSLLANESSLAVNEIGNYTCVVIDDLGCGASLSLFIDINSNLELLTKESTIEIYPNPSSSIFNIESQSGQLESVDLFDNIGTVLQSCRNINSSSHTMNMQIYPAGNYILKIQSSEGTVIKNLVKQ